MAFSPDGVMLVCSSGNLEAARFAGDMGSAAAAAPTTVPNEPIAAKGDVEKVVVEMEKAGEEKEGEKKEEDEEKENKPDEVPETPAAPGELHYRILL